ncbi:MAG: ATP-binding protein [Algoriphagus aquaeductus]|uniref:ATP-binding protein n=1 Tax=Algoriphagus aquaeductus TaxID=475299 RepID=UPI00391CE7D1
MKKQQAESDAEALKVYHRYWDSYTKGDLETFASTLDDHFEMIGTSEAEVCHSKADGISFYTAQMHEVVGKVEMRNRQIVPIWLNPLVLINEICDIYVKTDAGWNFYSKLRLSTLLRETRDGWKVVQQHGSLPDMRVGEGETLAIEKITKENLELRDAIKRRTIELENKSRELEIEASLERVRAVALGMQNPADILDICKVMFKELKSLGFTDLRNTIINFWDDSSNSLIDYDYSDFAGANSAKIAYSSHPIFEQFQKRIRKSKDSFAKLVVKKKYLESWKQRRRDSGEYEDPRLNDHSELYYYFYSIGVGAIGISTFNPLTNVNLDLLKRFRNVFVFAYRRYMDVAKAEAQAREAQIEAALERVRAQTMAMHSSEDVGKCVVKMFSELTALGVDEGTRFGIGILNHDNENNQLWTARKDGNEVNMHIGNIDMSAHPLLKSARKAWKEQVPFHKYVLEGEDLLNYYRMLNTAPGYTIQIPLEQLPQKEIQHCFIFEHGFFYAFSPHEFQSELIQVIKRFSSLFEQTYRRYLDLVRAEAQAKEAQIEAALERVRARAMAMHVSQELDQVAHELRTQIGLLGTNEQLETCAINLYDESEESVLAWGATRLPDSKNEIVDYNFYVPKVGIKLIEKILPAYKSNMEEYLLRLDGPDMVQWLNVLKRVKPDLFSLVDEAVDFTSTGQHTAWFSCAFFPGGTLVMITFSEPDNQSRILLKRFSQVFGLAYRRFADLKKAEAQAREAKIEAALERVRSRSLAMHGSDELNEVVLVLFERLNDLQIPVTAVGISINIEGSKELDNYTCGLVESGIAINKYRLPYFDHRIANDFFEAREKQLDFFVGNYSKQEKDSFYEYVINHTELKNELTEDIKQFIFQSPSYSISVVTTKNTMITLNDFEGKSLSDEEIDILKRFAKVFEQTYTRFLDLQKAEAQALEATKQASLDRVRGVIASMRSATDLELITPLIFRELTVLGVPFIRCGVFIINEKQELVEAYLSSPEGTSLGVLRLPFDASELTYQTVEAWRKGVIHRQHWSREDFVHWIRQLMEQDQIQDGSTYQGAAAPPESLDLHFVPFTQGMLYVGAVSILDEKELELVQALAKAFSIAYARYEDFVKLEQAKSEVESAMSELKSTQAQLIQQEKLASLGQLTAGIAHEIKNPLNFVNNFSEVSVDLIGETLEEMEKGEKRDHTLIRDNLEDLQSNLRKIREHGARANTIVTSMLQHSRGSSGKKEPTDLNVFIKESVNLSYHGMRAGKNPINVDIILDLDPEIKEVPLIKEDFSRVIINLCNNAFDAMRSKTLQGFETLGGLEPYQPKLTVRTKSENDHMLISVEDNGPGIPEEIKEKILQPFFTTKKGTEGTGLGLSIAHDIVKAHGGELKVKTKEGEGTEFIIQLPIV